MIKPRLFRIAQVMMIRFNQARDSSTVRPDLEKFIRRSATAAVTTAAIVLILRICLYLSLIHISVRLPHSAMSKLAEAASQDTKLLLMVSLNGSSLCIALSSIWLLPAPTIP